MKISLYELFTLIKENKAPNKIKYNNKIYEYDGEYYLTEEDNCKVCLGGLIDEINMLCCMFDEDEIEIIDEPKKIEKLNHWCNVYTWNIEIGTDRAFEEQSEYNKQLFYKLNEIIDKIEELEKK